MNSRFFCCLKIEGFGRTGWWNEEGEMRVCYSMSEGQEVSRGDGKRGRVWAALEVRRSVRVARGKMRHLCVMGRVAVVAAVLTVVI